VAIGDYDNDGRDDVYRSPGRDHPSTTKAPALSRVTRTRYPERRLQFERGAYYDRDGKLDLFVASYVQWTPEATSGVL
jgi:hypothetical protein